MTLCEMYVAITGYFVFMGKYSEKLGTGRNVGTT